jgi:signal transduction histidine kinase/CheY-like chemotaxis protein
MPGLSGDAERYRALLESIDEGFCVIEFIDGPHGPLSDYVHVEANPAYERNAGLLNVVGRKVRDLVGDEADGWIALYGGVLATGEAVRFEREIITSGHHIEVAAYRIGDGAERQVAVMFKDVTARIAAEKALHKLNATLEARIAEALDERQEAEAALRQAQKMEAIGQLTGGLAHDFNNLLAGISGAFEMIGTRLAQGRTADVERYLQAGQGAARRATALTHRLLAFSRRQNLSPKALIVNRLLHELAELVRRTVGPAVEVETVAASGLWPTLVDDNQLENALLNLCINARDAMPDGGRITIETANRWIDARGAAQHRLEPGQYVTICVSDTGTGIDKDDLDRVFDPFFTTKPIGQGTGLGLSMVYGFARQSHGHVRIYSELGQGTMVCIYLPRHDGPGDEDEPPAQGAAAPAQAGETILVIDDEPMVRMLIVDSLEDLGYGCLDAGDGPSGLKLLEANPHIDLLVTDVGLPGGLNGRQVAERARQLRPGLRILFVTGYAENAVLNHGHIERGMEVLTKPFAVDELARRVTGLMAQKRA